MARHLQNVRTMGSVGTRRATVAITGRKRHLARASSREAYRRIRFIGSSKCLENHGKHRRLGDAFVR
jgi:hypothetical protein